MAVKIRLKRLGKIRAPYYRIVVADSRTKRDGRVIEEIGKYHPTEEPSFIEGDSARAQYWLSVGAQPTEQVRAILKITGDWGTFKGDKNATSTLKTAETKEAFEADSAKKSVIKPKAEKKAEEAPAADADADAAPEAAESAETAEACSVLAAALEHVVKGIVDNPDDVRILSSESSRGEVLAVHVPPDDRGRVIGRGGRTAKAIRTLISALADGRRVRVDVADD